MTRHTATQWVCNRCEAKATTSTCPADLPPVGWRALDTNVDMAGELTSYDDLALCGDCCDAFDDFMVVVADVIDLTDHRAAAEVAARDLHPAGKGDEAEPFDVDLGLVEAGDHLRDARDARDARLDREQRWRKRADLIDHLTTLGPDGDKPPPGWKAGEIALANLEQLDRLHKIERAVAFGYQRDAITAWADSSIEAVLADHRDR